MPLQFSSRSHKILFWSLLVLAVAMVLAVAFALRGFNREMGREGDVEQSTQQTESSQSEKDPTQLSYCDDRTGDDRKQCESDVRDGQIYQQSLKQMSALPCEEIQDAELRGVCVDSVSSGQAYVKTQDPEEYLYLTMQGVDTALAVREYEKEVLQKGEEQVSIHVLIDLARAYANLSLTEHNESQLLPKAEHLLEVATRREPENLDILLVSAHLSEVREDFMKAISYYDQVLDKDVKHIDALVGRGHAYSMLGMIDLAKADFMQAETYDVDKKNPRIYSNLCRILSGDVSTYAEAISYCESVVKIPSVSPVYASQAHAILGDLYRKQGDMVRARDHLFQAESLYPNDANIKITLAQFYHATGDFDSAEQYARKALEKDGGKSMAYSELSYALYRKGEYQEAIQNARKGLEIVDQDVSLLPPYKPAQKREFYYTLANIYHRMGETAEELKAKSQGDAVFSENVAQ